MERKRSATRGTLDAARGYTTHKHTTISPTCTRAPVASRSSPGSSRIQRDDPCVPRVHVPKVSPPSPVGRLQTCAPAKIRERRKKRREIGASQSRLDDVGGAHFSLSLFLSFSLSLYIYISLRLSLCHSSHLDTPSFFPPVLPYLSLPPTVRFFFFTFLFFFFYSFASVRHLFLPLLLLRRSVLLFPFPTFTFPRFSTLLFSLSLSFFSFFLRFATSLLQNHQRARSTSRGGNEPSIGREQQETWCPRETERKRRARAPRERKRKKEESRSRCRRKRRFGAREVGNRATVAAAADSVDSVAERYLTREKRPAIR